MKEYRFALRKAEELFLCFLLVAFIGWAYEVFLEIFIYCWGYSNRGVLCGPYCPVYGVGALVLLACVSPMQRRRIAIGRVSLTPFLVFLSIVALTTAIELAASYIMEWTSGNWMWDYTRFRLHFQGRIALNPSLRFGVGGMLFLYLLYPAFQRLLARCAHRSRTALAGVLGGIFLMDCVVFLL